MKFLNFHRTLNLNLFNNIMKEKKEAKESEEPKRRELPEEYKPYESVSVDRRNERYFRDFDDED